MVMASKIFSWRPSIFHAGRIREAPRAGRDSLRSTVFTKIKMLDVAGQSLRVGIRHGKSSSPPLVIFNGIGANLELLEPFVSALKGIEIVVFDVPGVGGSPPPKLPYRYARIAQLTNRLLTALDTEQVDVLGLSWGGMLAQQYAYLNPKRCRRLILAATSSGWTMLPGHFSAVRKLTSPRRHRDPDYFRRIAPELYGGSFRQRPDLFDRHIGRTQPSRGVGLLLPTGRPVGMDQHAVAASPETAHIDPGRDGGSDRSAGKCEDHGASNAAVRTFHDR
jgi:pimeloyl-ACP methyl ester carboxylesterase